MNKLMLKDVSHEIHEVRIGTSPTRYQAIRPGPEERLPSQLRITASYLGGSRGATL